MRILLSAFIGSYNIGDEAITEVMLKKFDYAGVETTVLSTNPSRTGRVARGTSTTIKKNSLGGFIKGVKEADAVVLGGGGIIQDQVASVANMTRYFLETLVAGMVYRKPVYLVFVGVGPIRSRLSSLMLRIMKYFIKHSLVRDKGSAELLVKHGFNAEDITTAYDIVFNIDVATPAHHRKQDSKNQTLIFSPCDWFHIKTYLPSRYALKWALSREGSPLNQYRKRLVELVKLTLDQNPNLTVVGVPFYYVRDLELLKYVKSNLSDDHKERFRIDEADMLPADYVKVASRADAVLGIRLHSLILGAVAGTSLVPVTYSAKVRSLVQYLKLDQHTTDLKKPNFDIALTVKNIKDVLEQRPVASRQSLEEIRSSNDLAFDKLIKVMNLKNH